MKSKDPVCVVTPLPGSFLMNLLDILGLHVRDVAGARTVGTLPPAQIGNTACVHSESLVIIWGLSACGRGIWDSGMVISHI